MATENPDNETSKPRPPDAGVRVTGDVNTGGGDFTGRDKIINIAGIKIPRAVAPLAVIALIVVLAGIGIIAFNTSAITGVVTAPTPTVTATVPTATPTATPLPTATSLAFATAVPDEILILIATFHSTAAINTEPHFKIWRRIEEELKKLGESGVRVAVEPTKLRADTWTEANTLGTRYNASMIIWGEDTGVEVIVSYLYLKGSYFANPEGHIVERERTQFIDPESYAQFITTDLPKQFTFLALFSISESYYANGKLDRALAIYQQALAIVQESNDRYGEETILKRIGITSVQLGQYEKALQSYQRLLYIGRERGDRQSEIVWLNNIGYIFAAQGQRQAALEHFQQALAITRQIGDRKTETTMLANIGSVYEQQEQYQAALEYFQQALAITRQIGDRKTETTTLANIGSVYEQQEQYQAALEYYQPALAITQEIDDRYGIGETLDHIGHVYYALGRYDEARQVWEQALRIFEGIGVPNAYSVRQSLEMLENQMNLSSNK